MSNRSTDAFILDAPSEVGVPRSANSEGGTNNVFAVQTNFEVKRDKDRAPIRLAGVAHGGHKKHIERSLQSPFSVELGQMKPRRSTTDTPLADPSPSYNSTDSWLSRCCSCFRRPSHSGSQYEALPASATAANELAHPSNSLFGDDLF